MDVNFRSMLFSSIIAGIWETLPMIWPIGALILIGFLARLFSFLLKQQQYKKAGFDVIDKMSGQEFELYLMNLFTSLGYQTEHIGKLGDYGGDLIITKDGIKTLVQAKRQRYRVKESAVQQALAAREYYHCNKAMVVTNNYYYGHAWNLGKKTNTTLWTRKELNQAILSVK